MSQSLSDTAASERERVEGRLLKYVHSLAANIFRYFFREYNNNNTSLRTGGC